MYYAPLKSIQLFPPLLLLSYSGLSSFHTDLGSNTSRLTSWLSSHPTHHRHMLSEWSFFFNVDLIMLITFLSVQFSRSVVSNYLWPRGLQNTRLPCPPSPTPRVYSTSCPLSWWCHPTISSFIVPFSSCPQSFPASESFPRSRFFVSVGQSIGASASVSVLPVNIRTNFL